ncbi:hypothetical protein ALC57_17682, partial [Trachymyrmex cornetzi]
RARGLDSTSDRLGNGQDAYPSEQIERKAQEIRCDNDDNQRWQDTRKSASSRSRDDEKTVMVQPRLGLSPERPSRANSFEFTRLVELRAAAIRRRCLFTLSCHPFDIVAVAGSRFRFG